MSERLGNRLRLGLLSFALIFTATALLQYQFSAWQMRRVVTSELQSWGEELRDSVVGDGRWQLPAFRQSAPAAPDYFIVSRAGLLVEVDGFVPGLLPRVFPPTWPTDGKPHRVRSPLDEEWLLLGHTVRGGFAEQLGPASGAALEALAVAERPDPADGWRGEVCAVLNPVVQAIAR